VRSVLGPPPTQGVIAEITGPAGKGSGGFARRRRSGIYRTIEMPVYDRFVAARREAIPAAYLIPGGLTRVVELLRRHGIAVERLNGRISGPLEAFMVDSVLRGPLFEGHNPVQVEGSWSRGRTESAVPGWYLVRTTQPLGVLAAYLLEPASEDGVVSWNLLDAGLAPVPALPDPALASVGRCRSRRLPRRTRCSRPVSPRRPSF
jgi:hypothetical protein